MKSDDSIEISNENGIVTVSFLSSSLCDPEAVSVAARELKDYFEKHQPPQVVIDFANVKFFTSQVLGILLSIQGKMEKYGGEIIISGLKPELYRVFKITNLVDIFRFCNDKQTALSELKGR